ncbi:MAG: septum formation initiator family protein [Clostridia bacterium]|nr:septum formation initiator family protein [Clostridia bacterium]
MEKKRGRVRPFRILSVCLGLAALVMLSRFPAKAVSLERQQEQLELAAQAYYDAQSEHNRLTTELAEINTQDFIERTARREYGYCWYGEIIYEVSNLEELKAAQPFAVYGQE